MLPATPAAHALGFQPLPAGFFVAPAAMVGAYLCLVQIGKHLFYAADAAGPAVRHRIPVRHQIRVRVRHLRRRHRPAPASVSGPWTGPDRAVRP